MVTLGDPFLDKRIEAAFEAVRGAFPYLETAEIISPPMGATNGAVLARQLVIHILVETFDIPKKQVDRAGLAERSTARMACHAINDYRASPRFAAFADRIVEAAKLTVERWEEQYG